MLAVNAMKSRLFIFHRSEPLNRSVCRFCKGCQLSFIALAITCARKILFQQIPACSAKCLQRRGSYGHGSSPFRSQFEHMIECIAEFRRLLGNREEKSAQIFKIPLTRHSIANINTLSPQVWGRPYGKLEGSAVPPKPVTGGPAPDH